MSGDNNAPGEDAAGQQRRRALWQSLLYGIVTIGGVIGSLLRWGVSLAYRSQAGCRATVVANATGCFAIGFYATFTGPGAGCSWVREHASF
jgi:fluoride ion exporter CrcB/FEX